MRNWLNDARSYIEPVKIGEVMRALGIGRVVDSKSERFRAGDLVSCVAVACALPAEDEVNRERGGDVEEGGGVCWAGGEEGRVNGGEMEGSSGLKAYDRFTGRSAGRLIMSDRPRTCGLSSKSGVDPHRRIEMWAGESILEEIGDCRRPRTDIRTPRGGRDIDHLGLFGISGKSACSSTSRARRADTQE